MLFELGDGLSRINQRALAIAMYDRLRTSPRLRIMPTSLDLEAAAWELFRQRLDKTWGVTDCASFVVMKQLGIEAAFTVDRHFEQAGFQRLIQPQEIDENRHLPDPHVGAGRSTEAAGHFGTKVLNRGRR